MTFKHRAWPGFCASLPLRRLLFFSAIFSLWACCYCWCSSSRYRIRSCPSSFRIKKNESKATRSNLGQRTRETRQTGSAFRPRSSGEATIFSRFRKASGSSGPSPTPQEKCRGGVKSQFQLKHRSSHVSQYWCQNVQWLAKVARPQSSTLRWKRNNLWTSIICF